MTHSIACVRTLLLATVALLSLSAVALAAQDPNGKWLWSLNAPDGQKADLAVTLKFEDGGKITGKAEYGEDSTEISDGMFTDDELTFNVTREQDGNKFTAKFKGKVNGDAISGMIDVVFNDQTISFEWNATREKK